MSDSQQTAKEATCTNDYSVQVTLAGREFDPARATEIIGIEPDKTGTNGERVLVDPPSPSDDESTAAGRFWSRELNSRDEVTQCRDHLLTCLIDDVAPHVGALKEAGMERIYFYYTLASSIGLLNVKFSPETMKRLGDLGADLYLSCFDCFDGEHLFWSDSVSAEAES